MEVKIVFYNKTLLSGGIEKCIELLSKKLYGLYDIDVVYTHTEKLDPNIVKVLNQYANVYQITDQIVDCDVAVWCFLYFDYHNLKKQIRAPKNIAWVHSMPRILPGCLLDDDEFVDEMDEIVCVSEAVKNHLQVKKEGIVVHNFMPENILELSNINPAIYPNDSLNLVVVSRLSRGKGFDRLLILCQTLKEKRIPFHLTIVGKGRADEEKIKKSFAPYSEVEFVGYQENPYRYVKNADYLVQLSDDESWCNTITEAKILGVPVIVTNFESSKEQVTDLINGIIIPLEETDYSSYVDIALSHKKDLRDNVKGFKFENEIEAWYQLFEEKVKGPRK